MDTFEVGFLASYKGTSFQTRIGNRSAEARKLSSPRA
jgi:hypothetical protein